MWRNHFKDRTVHFTPGYSSWNPSGFLVSSSKVSSEHHREPWVVGPDPSLYWLGCQSLGQRQQQLESQLCDWSGSWKRCLKGSQWFSEELHCFLKEEDSSILIATFICRQKNIWWDDSAPLSQPHLPLSLHRILNRQRYLNLLAWAQFLIPP